MNAVSVLRNAEVGPADRTSATVRWRLGKRDFPGRNDRGDGNCNQFASSPFGVRGFASAPDLEISR